MKILDTDRGAVFFSNVFVDEVHPRSAADDATISVRSTQVGESFSRVRLSKVAFLEFLRRKFASPLTKRADGAQLIGGGLAYALARETINVRYELIHRKTSP